MAFKPYAYSKTEHNQAKQKAIITEIERMYKKGRPVLVGTTSVEQSEIISQRLTSGDIKHQVSLIISWFTLVFLATIESIFI